MKRWLLAKLILAGLITLTLSGARLEAQTINSGSITTDGDIVSAVLPVDTRNVTLSVTGTWTGTIDFQVLVGSGDGEWFAIQMFDEVNGDIDSDTTATGVWSKAIAGFRAIRAIATEPITGTAVISIYEGAGGTGMASGTDSGLGDLSLANVSDNIALTQDTLATSSAMLMYDGTNLDMVRGNTTDGLLVNTELGAAVASNTGLSNPTAPWVLAANFCPSDATGAPTWSPCYSAGHSRHYRTSAGSTEDEHEIKNSPGRLFSFVVTNTNAAVRYVRCANLTAANTTPGTSTVFIGFAVPGATTGDGIRHNFGPEGIAFDTALTCWAVTGAADSDVAEVAANEMKFIWEFN